LPSNSTTESLNLTCQYYDETEKVWKMDGVETSSIKLVSIPENPSILKLSAVCKTYHLTSFAIIETNLKKELTNNKPNTQSNTGSDQTSVVIAAVVASIGGVCVIGTVIALVGVLVALFIRFKRKKQSELLNSQL